jgi:redox-sensitive bicupin YhaK (pirin superfamily)
VWYGLSIQFSRVVAAQAQGNGRAFSVRAIKLDQLGRQVSPILVLDEFRVSGRPFPPHPHAGFSAVTYVFEDSPGDLRTRDSLGHDVVTGAGGIVWTQAGSGLIHEEVPADSNRELHAIQIFVNLSSKNKLAYPQMLRLQAGDVPEWRNAADDRVRVVVGSFEGILSPLVPAEPFNLLDVDLRSEISFTQQNSQNALVYVLEGGFILRADGHEQELTREHAMALYGGRGRVRFMAAHRAHFLILSGFEIREPVFADGPFVMNERRQVEDAIARYQAGAMGRLAPVSES